MAEGGKKDAANIASNVISVVNEFCAEDHGHHQCWQLWECVFSLKAFLHPRASKTSGYAHGHIHTKIRNKLGPETTEPRINLSICSNSTMAVTICDVDKLTGKMSAWVNKLGCVALTCALPGPALSA